MPSRIEELRVRAHLLLKALRSDDPGTARGAADRFSRHPRWNGRQVSADQVRLKHALDVVAREAGKPDWATLKRTVEAHVESDLFYPRPSGSLCSWYRTWEEARAHLDGAGGYLLPYRHQCFVCGPAHIASLGLSPDDPDWARIGYDGVKPADAAAWERLQDRLRSQASG